MDPALRIVVALVLLGAAAAKLRDRRALVAAVGDHGVPPTLRPAVATGLVAAELALGVLILIPATPTPSPCSPPPSPSWRSRWWC